MYTQNTEAVTAYREMGVLKYSRKQERWRQMRGTRLYLEDLEEELGVTVAFAPL